MPKPDAKSASIVLLGNFNPSIFHPQWFAAHDVVSQNEADQEAELEITTQQASVFSITLGRVQVTGQQFVITGRNPALFKMLNDFVIKTFDILTHTPVHAMGINLEQKWLSNDEQWHRDFGDRIAPKHKWDFMKDPGVRDIVMEDQDRPDGRTGYIQARIRALRQKPLAILISVNDHYEIPDYKTSMGASPMLDILRTSWDTSIQRSESIIHNIIKNFS
jgi:hypothetical protein